MWQPFINYEDDPNALPAQLAFQLIGSAHDIDGEAARCKYFIEQSGAWAATRATTAGHGLTCAIKRAERYFYTVPEITWHIFNAYLMPVLESGGRIDAHLLSGISNLHDSPAYTAILHELAEIKTAPANMQSLTRRSILATLPLGTTNRRRAINSLNLPFELLCFLQFSDLKKLMIQYEDEVEIDFDYE